MDKWLSSQEWLESLDVEARAEADRLIRILERFGASDPVSWVRSEMSENIPQVAIFLFLHEVRTQFVTKFFYRWWSLETDTLPYPEKVMEEGEKAFDRLAEAGVDPEELERLARGAACRATTEFIDLLDGLSDSELDDIKDVPRWKLAEVIGGLRGQGHFTGRCLDSLHESFGALYPTDP